MPIRAENRWFYPIDWPELSHHIRFDRAGSRCEQCRRPHMTWIIHTGDGNWFDAAARAWRDGRGRRLRRRPMLAFERAVATYAVIACAHLDHDTANNGPKNLAALCQRCHMLHDADEHRWQRWWNAFRKRALGDLFTGRYDGTV